MSRPKGSKNKPKEFREIPPDKIDLEIDELPTPRPETTPPGTRGILLIALGHPMYGRMAYNLLTSIRFADKDVKVHLVHNGNSMSHLSDEEKNQFTSSEICPKEFYTKNGKDCFIKAKTRIYELSPFDETIFMDVDLVVFGKRPISGLFDELKDLEFTMQNRGYTNLDSPVLNESFNLWANIKEVRDVYGANGKFYQLASEVIYFKKTKANRIYFELVADIFDNPKIKGATFNGDLPDEFAYDIATAVLKHYPHQDNWVPIYWHLMDKKQDFNKVIGDYWGYSIGGNFMPAEVQKRYSSITKYNAQRLGVRNHIVHPKRQWNTLRKTI